MGYLSFSKPRTSPIIDFVERDAENQDLAQTVLYRLNEAGSVSKNSNRCPLIMSSSRTVLSLWRNEKYVR